LNKADPTSEKIHFLFDLAIAIEKNCSAIRIIYFKRPLVFQTPLYPQLTNSLTTLRLFPGNRTHQVLDSHCIELEVIIQPFSILSNS
jgi:hypothetical protein